MASRKNGAAVESQVAGGENAWDDVLEGQEEGDEITAPVAPEDVDISLDRDTHEPMSIGTHKARVQFRGVREGGSGYPYVFLRLDCLDDDELGYEALDRLSLSPAARWRLDNFLDAIGADRKGQVKASSFDGKIVYVTVDHEDYQGAVTPRAVKYHKAEPTDVGAEGAEPTAAEFR